MCSMFVLDGNCLLGASQQNEPRSSLVALHSASCPTTINQIENTTPISSNVIKSCLTTLVK